MECDRSQVAATREGRIADARHAVWDGDGGQAGATREGTVADAGHAVRDSDGGQAAASIVFATCCVSEDFN